MKTEKSAGAWTETEKDELERWRDYGMSFSQIGGMLGRSKNACRGMYQRLKSTDRMSTPLRPWTDEEDAMLRELALTNMTNAQIGKKLNRTRGAIDMRKRALGLSARPQGETLCWRCKHSAGKNMCSWARFFVPVEGWDAQPTMLASSQGRMRDSFHVRKCPQFEKEERA